MTKAISMVLDRIEAQRDNQLDLGPTATALDLLQAVYRDPAQELHTRIRCAMACLPFQSPKLIATAVMNENSFADLLERRLRRLQEMKLIEQKPIAQPETDTTTAEPEPSIDLPSGKSAPAPLSRLYSTRMWPRRF